MNDKRIKDLFEFSIGDIVYLKTDRDQCKRIVTGLTIRSTGILYGIACGTSETFHYGFEVTSDVDVLMRTTD